MNKRTISVRSIYGGIVEMPIAPETAIREGDALTVDERGFAVPIARTEEGSIGKSLVSVRAIATPSPSPSQRERFQAELNKASKPRQNPRYLPTMMNTNRLEIGDVVVERSGVNTRSVLLSKVERPDGRYKLTFRRLGDDAFRSVVVGIAVPWDVVADVNFHEGDPDHYMTHRFAADEALRKKRREDPRALPEWQEKEVQEDVRDAGGFVPGEQVWITGRVVHSGSEATVVRVRHLSMGGETLVMVDVLVKTLQGEIGVAVEPRNLRRRSI